MCIRDSISTADVIKPSTKPIAKWIGCINDKNVKNGSSVTPEINVSKVTLKAPSCKLKTLPNILAINIFFFDGFLLNIGLYMQKYPKKG